MITETDRLSGALDLAAGIWSDAGGDRGALLRKIIDTGVAAIEREAELRRVARSDTINRVAASFSSVWPAQWREELRDEWPA